MGKKAKKRKEHKENPSNEVTRNLVIEEFKTQIDALMDDPDWELKHYDPEAFIWIFINQRTLEITTIGDREACLKMRAAWQRVIAEERAAQMFGGKN